MRRRTMTTRVGASAGAIALGLTILAAAPASQAAAQAAAPRPAASADEADYYWIDNADALADAIGDSPPDFTFAYDDGEPWGWRTSTGHEVYAEPLGDGAIRYYYYFEPDSDVPFLVQDSRFTFGYRDARLAVVYDSDGRVLPRGEGNLQVALATRLYRRGRALRDAAQVEDNWDSIDASYWAQQIPTVVELRLRWSSGKSRYDGWKRWRGRPGSTSWRGSLAGERDWRWSAGDRFRRWQRDGFQGPPPRFGDRGQRPGRGVRPPRDGSWQPGTRPSRPDGQPGTGRPPWGGPGQPGTRPPRLNPLRPGVDRAPPPPVSGEPMPPVRGPDGAGSRPARPDMGRPRPRAESPAPVASPPPGADQPTVQPPPRPRGGVGMRPIERLREGLDPRRERPIVTEGPRMAPPAQSMPARPQFQPRPAPPAYTPPPPEATPRPAPQPRAYIPPPAPAPAPPPPPPRREPQSDTTAPQ